MLKNLNLPPIVKKLLFPFIILIAFLILNPFSINDSGERTHVQTIFGESKVRFEPGMYYSGFFSTLTEYPNNIVLVCTDSMTSKTAHYIEPRVKTQFNDGTKADAGLTTVWKLPSDEMSMIKIHQEYRSPERLIEALLIKYTRECLKYSMQLMELISGSL